MMDFTESQIQRYARHIILPEVGGIGQNRLLRARVLVVGAGGLGSVLIQYLAAAGVGTIGVVDDDCVDLSNLQRQIIHTTSRVGMAKAQSAAIAVADLNPDVTLIPIQHRLDRDNIQSILNDYDIVADGSDNFPTRFLVNDACYLARKPLVSAAILRFDGQLSTYRPNGPCYRCLYREAPPAGLVPTCSSAGILGAMAGIMGSLQACEVMKEILEIGDSMSGRLLILDGLSMTMRTVRVKQDPGCPLCGQSPQIHDLSGHESTAHVCG